MNLDFGFGLSGFLRIWIWTLDLDFSGFLGFGSGLLDFLVFSRIVVDRDVKMGFSAGGGAAFSYSAIFLRRLVTFSRFL